jgi:hypothetical protein
LGIGVGDCAADDRPCCEPGYAGPDTGAAVAAIATMPTTPIATVPTAPMSATTMSTAAAAATVPAAMRAATVAAGMNLSPTLRRGWHGDGEGEQHSKHSHKNFTHHQLSLKGIQSLAADRLEVWRLPTWRSTLSLFESYWSIRL